MSCCNEADIDLSLPGFANAFYFSLLEYPEEFDLNEGADFPDLIQKLAPPAASSNRPFPSLMAPVKAPLA